MSEDHGDTTHQATQETHPSFAHYEDRAQVLSYINTSARLVSNSEVATFRRCRRKWWLAWYQGLRQRLENPTGPRAIGDRIHRCLSFWYVPDGTPRIEPQETLERLITEDWQRVVDHYTSIGEDIPPGTIADFTKDANLERAMLEGYMQWISEDGQDANLVITSSEQYMQVRFPVPTENLPVFLIGKFDVRAQRTSDGVRLFIDHKTVAEFVKKTRTVHMDPQMLHYHLMEFLSIEDATQRCDGALYNMIRRVGRTKTAKPPFYQRIDVMHNQTEIDNYAKKLKGIITDITHVENSLAAGYEHQYVAYSNPTGDCTWDCDFFVACHLFDDGSRADAMINQFFVRGDPLSYYTKDEGGK